MADKTLPRSGIYCIRNMVSGRLYVGSAVFIEKRWTLHRSLLNRGRHHSITLQRSWIKYGASAFSFEILEIVEDKAALVGREQHWIDEFNSSCPRVGYNIAPKAGTSLGRIHPPEVRAKISAKARGKKRGPFTDEHRARISASHKGHSWNKGIKKTAEHRAKLSAAKRGVKHPAVAASNRRRRLGDLTGQLKLL